MRHGPAKLVFAILAAWLLAGFLAAPTDAAAAEKIVVAITSPQSGPQAAWGSELIRGACWVAPIRAFEPSLAPSNPPNQPSNLRTIEPSSPA